METFDIEKSKHTIHTRTHTHKHDKMRKSMIKSTKTNNRIYLVTLIQ